MPDNQAHLPEVDIAVLVADLARLAVAGGTGFTAEATARVSELLRQHGNQQFNAGREFEQGRQVAQATTAPVDADLVRRATPGVWFVRRHERLGEVRDAFVAAPDCQGLPYDAEVLGEDEYREDTGIVRKQADCELIVAAVNDYKARAGLGPVASKGNPCAA